MTDYANPKAGNSATGKTPTLWSIKQSLPFTSCILYFAEGLYAKSVWTRPDLRRPRP